ncbi:MAG: DUF4458 domain-containing protein [Alistipes sp.]
MKFNTLFIKISLTLLAFATLALSGCSSDEGIDNREHGYGNLQFRLYKKGTTRASNELEYLRDARKVQVNFLHEGRNFNQTLLLFSSDAESAEFGLRSESIKLSAGEYQILSFVILDELERTILTEKFAEPVALSLAEGQLTMQDLMISAVLRGKVYIQLSKDLSGIPTRAAEVGREYTFDEIKTADLTLVDTNDPRHKVQLTNMTCDFVSDVKNSTSYVLCDTLYIEAGTYRLQSLLLRDENALTIDYAEKFDAQDARYTFKIEDISQSPLQKAEVPVKINATAAYIKDYIALRDIWEATGGTKDPDRKAWYYLGDNYPAGANWDFDKDVDLWGHQPGVLLHNNGRVAALMIGDFDPYGAIPDAIGQMTELTELVLGTHNDTCADDAKPAFDKHGDPFNEYISKTYVSRINKNGSGSEFNAGTYLKRGQFSSVNRLERALRENNARAVKQNDTELFSAMRLAGQLKPWRGDGIAVYTDVQFGYLTNHITGISPEVSKCTKLETIFIANSLIEELPETLSQLKNLTGLELYNNPKMKKFPTVVAGITGLIQINFANNTQWSSDEILNGINAMFDPTTGASAKTLQLVYFNNNNLTEMPENLKHGAKLGMIQLSNNKIETLHALGTVGPIQFFLDNNRLTGQPFPNDGKDFCVMDDIETFSCAGNQITNFPKHLFSSKSLYTLGAINFSRNKISTIDGSDDAEWDDKGNLTRHSSFGGVKCTQLNLNDNLFKGGIPDAFATSDPISEFESLSMQINKLDSVGWKGLKGMYSITALDLESNNISVYTKNPNFFLGLEVPFLTGIDFNLNAFAEFPSRMFNGYGIMQLYFENQADRVTGERCFKKWPAGIETYAQLKVLRMAGNDIRKIDKFPYGVNFFSIDDNPNIEMVVPDDMCARITGGTLKFVYDRTQLFITGCPALGIGEE